jgi:hypothetical protein
MGWRLSDARVGVDVCVEMAEAQDHRRGTEEPEVAQRNEGRFKKKETAICSLLIKAILYVTNFFRSVSSLVV